MKLTPARKRERLQELLTAIHHAISNCKKLLDKLNEDAKPIPDQPKPTPRTGCVRKKPSR